MAPWLQQLCQGLAGVAVVVVAALVLKGQLEWQIAVAGFGLSLIANAVRGPNQVSLADHLKALKAARSESVPPEK